MYVLLNICEKLLKRTHVQRHIQLLICERNPSFLVIRGNRRMRLYQFISLVCQRRSSHMCILEYGHGRFSH
jgi:hypothetical protein